MLAYNKKSEEYVFKQFPILVLKLSDNIRDVYTHTFERENRKYGYKLEGELLVLS